MDASERKLLRVVGGSCLALFVPLLLPLATGRVFVRGDILDFHLPLRFLYQDALRNGDSLLWSPALLSGFYLHAEGQAGMYHPLHLLLYGLLPLDVAFNLEVISSYVFALAGAYLLLRHVRLSAPVALFGAALFAFSGFNLLHLNHVNAVAVLAHVPWLLLAADVALCAPEHRRRARALVAVALLLGSQLLLGYPQYVWMTGVVMAGHAAFRTVTSSPGRRTLWLVAASVLGVCLGAVQLAPTVDGVAHSSRMQVLPDFILELSLHPLNLMQLWSPYALPYRAFSPESPGVESDRNVFVHEYGVYDGAFCTVALFWLFLRRREVRSRKLVMTAVVLCALATVLALGRYSGVYTLLAQMPGVGLLRAPARHIALLHLGLALLAAVALEDLGTVVRGGHPVPVRRLVPLAVPVMLSVGTGVALAGGTPMGQAEFGSAGGAAGVALVVAAAGLMALAARGWTTAFLLLPLLALADLGVWGFSYNWWEPPQTLEHLRQQDLAAVNVGPGVSPGDLRAERILARRNVGVLSGYRLAGGYVGLPPARTLDPARPRTQRLSGVGWLRREHAQYRAVLRPSAVGSGITNWVRATDACPRVRLVYDARVSQRVRVDIRDVDIEATALVTRTLPPLRGPGAVQLVSDRPGHIEVDVTTEGDALLVTTEAFHEGWRATDGTRQLSVERSNGDYLGVVIPAGMHRVQLTFAPWSARLGLWVTVAASLLTAGLGVLAYIPRRPAGSATS